MEWGVGTGQAGGRKALTPKSLWEVSDAVHNITPKRKRQRNRNRGANAKIPRGLRKQILYRDGPYCRYCGVKVSSTLSPSNPRFLTLDHIHPVTQGGWSTAANLVVACKACNNWKGDRLLGKATKPDGKGKGGRVLIVLRPVPVTGAD